MFMNHTQVTNVQWNRSGSKLASASFDGTVKLWAFDHGMFQSSAPVSDLKAHNGGVDAVSKHSTMTPQTMMEWAGGVHTGFEVI